MRIVLAGGGGFIGSHLIPYFEQQGHEVVALSRKPDSPHFWNPEAGVLDTSLLEGSTVVINLCGENVFGRWTEQKKVKIRESRIGTTHLLCESISRLKQLPALYIGASAIGYYGNRDEEILIESSWPGNDFLAEVCKQWEGATHPLVGTTVRTVIARLGIVLGKEGGVLKHIEKAFRMGMGGVLGSGKQMMSWIAIDDICHAMHHVIHHQELSGAVNFVAPEAVTNTVFTQTIGKILHRPTLVPIPKFALSMLFGEGSETFLASTHAYPQRLLESGYPFIYPTLEEPLKKYLIHNC